MKGEGRRAIIAAFLANLGIAFAKTIGFIFTGAASMLAEAVHSFADTSNQGLLILGGNLAKRKKTREHQFGFGRERYFWAFVVAVVIFSLGAVFAIYEGLTKLVNPHDIDSPLWAVGILLFAIIVESYSMKIAIHESRKVKGKMGWWAFIRHSKVPELPVVLLEDLGALVGLALALAGVGLAMWTGDSRFDAMGSLSIGILLGIIAVILGIEMRSLLLGESASEDTQAKLEKAIRNHPKVCKLIHIRTEHIGPEELLVAAKVELSGELDAKGVAAAINSIEKVMRSVVEMKLTIYIEPDIFNGEECPAK
ncbi:MAG: cation diffusion facilitator family transporter [Thermoplasmata archaeon]|nr:cation diffusion facilitator family transporter [Thermoplasmata archaeon]